MRIPRFAALALLLTALPAAALPVKDWVRPPEYRQAVISPHGTYLAVVMAEPHSQRYELAVMTTESILAGKPKTTARIGLGDHELFERIFWVNDDRLAASTAHYVGGFDRPFLDGNLISVDARGGSIEHLMGTNSGGQLGTRIHGSNDKRAYFLGFLSRLPAQRNIILVEGLERGSDRPFAYKLDVVSGRRFRVATGLFAGGMLADHTGRVRFMWGADQLTGHLKLNYLPPGSDEWKDSSSIIASSSASEIALDFVNPIMFGPQNKTVYAALWTDNAAETLGLYRINLKTGKRTLIYANPTVDIGIGAYPNTAPFIVSLDRKSLVGLRTMPGTPDTTVTDAHSAKIELLAALSRALPNQRVEITSWTDDGSAAIVRSWSDRRPTAFYLYSARPTPKLALLFRVTPWITPADLSPMRAITYKARDGLTIHGYLTIPRGAKAKDLPLVIYVHGGPHGFRYQWGFDDRNFDSVATEILADHGYAVLAPNYRGSGGYGLKFLEAGFHHWGDTMQDDLADAVSWAVGQGIADPNRICILGAAYGGYAALTSAERFPDIFRCAVGYSGVYDLPLLETRATPADRFAVGRFQLKAFLGTDKKQLRAFSPVFHADSIKAAVFLLHGGEDKTAPPKGYHEMVAAIREHGTPLKTLYEPDEGHGFYTPAHRAAAWTEILAFLNEYIGPKAKAGRHNVAPSKH